MAEGGPGIHEKRSGMGDWREDPRSAERQAERERSIKKLFSSVQWYYPVHKYIGDIVQENKLRADYHSLSPRYQRLCYLCYCDLVSEIMKHWGLGCMVGGETIAAAVLKVLSTHTTLTKDSPLDAADALIPQKDVVYVLGTYSQQCFNYLLTSFAIDLKDSCRGFVDNQLQELAKTKPAIANLEKKIRKFNEFDSKQSNKLFEQKKESVKRIDSEGIRRSNYLTGLKRSVPLFLIISEEIDPKKIPLPRRDSDSWEDYLLKVYKNRLNLTLEKEKGQWDADLSKPDAYLHRQLQRLEKLVDYRDLPGENPPLPGTYIMNFQDEISRQLKSPDNVEEIRRLKLN